MEVGGNTKVQYFFQNPSESDFQSEIWLKWVKKSLWYSIWLQKTRLKIPPDFLKQFDEIFVEAKSGSALPREIGSENGSELFLLPKSESGAKL